MSTGFCVINPRLLAEALHMPEGTEIDNAQWDFYGERILLRVRHPSIASCPEGCPPMPVRLLVTAHHDVESPDRVALTYTGEWK